MDPVHQQTYRYEGFVVPIGVDGRQQVDPGLLHQVTYPLVACQILETHELHQQEEQLSSQHLVTMGTRCVTKLRFTWSTGSDEGSDEGKSRGERKIKYAIRATTAAQRGTRCDVPDVIIVH